MSATRFAPETTATLTLAARPSRFGDLAMLVFVFVQVLDGALTYLGVHAWGLAVEANPLVSSAVSVAGIGGGLAATKLFAVALGIVLHLRQVHGAIAALSAFYIGVAIVPWAVMFMTLP